ncbi:hypothetical protein L228DRAFT_258437 [Xylona heveae TC161]|uniref:F-box domain-containing protein n=1 Tax=Xylona heveae (strain CBS 132557 / TC161) TaxID=1328760 RepID=A0A165IIA2_XYLHT|nr:hypothetical protein L228DRAFT_258437 [Xylona heveae TC161]KZF24938.1 hypothetical protein L228DRAFT_258437 [Xylona heveae TC161]
MLSDLPFELLGHIVTDLPSAQCVYHLSLTCRRLNSYVQEDGWRTFTQTRFPSIAAPPYWRDAALSLTTLSRNWDRKAFLARYIHPAGSVTQIAGHGRRPGGRRKAQTMGYQPVLDSCEEQTGNNWASKKEILAWGAGAELVLRNTLSGDAADQKWKESPDDERVDHFDQHHRKVDWVVYKEESHADGRDDITTVNILRPSQRHPDVTSAGYQDIVVGRASGELSLVELSPEKVTDNVKTRYNTGNKPIRSADISPSNNPLLAVSLSDSLITFFPVYTSQPELNRVAEVSAVPADRRGRTWSTRFLSNERLAVGLGPSTEPIHIYEVAPDGVVQRPMRTFGSGSSRDNGDTDSLDIPTGASSVYPISPIHYSSPAGGNPGDLFLSGWYDGVSRLHDMRSPAQCVAKYQDPIDDSSAVYSLQTIGLERFIVGAARHGILKVFDLRMSGGKSYFSTSVDACNAHQSSRNPPTPAPADSGICCDWHYETQHDRRDWSVFLNPRGPAFYRQGSRRSAESPIYSLSSPSPSSPALYAGVENNVVQLDFVSIMDRAQDPVFQYGGGSAPGSIVPPATHASHGSSKPRFVSEETNVINKWDPSGDVLRLALYEQVPMSAMRLRVQASVGACSSREAGWDERWCDGRGYY